MVAHIQDGADLVRVAINSQEAFKGLKAAADDHEGVTFTRLLGFFLQMGMNGLILKGIRWAAIKLARAGKAVPMVVSLGSRP